MSIEFGVKNLSREIYEYDIRGFLNFMHKINCQQAACDKFWEHQAVLYYRANITDIGNLSTVID